MVRSRWQHLSFQVLTSSTTWRGDLVKAHGAVVYKLNLVVGPFDHCMMVGNPLRLIGKVTSIFAHREQGTECNRVIDCAVARHWRHCHRCSCLMGSSERAFAGWLQIGRRPGTSGAASIWRGFDLARLRRYFCPSAHSTLTHLVIPLSPSV